MGNSVERFLNTCSYKGIILWDLSSCQSHYEANIMLRDFKKLKPVIRKTRTKVFIVNRTGFPFFIHKYHKRKLFFLGFIICISLMLFFSTFIWDIEITGNQTCTTETILYYLQSKEIHNGMKRKQIDCQRIAADLRKQFDDIIWVSASVNGSKLYIQIKENIDSVKMSESETEDTIPYDIISNTDCIITKVIIRNGLTSVSEGQQVRSGELLVSGHIPVLNDAKEITNYQYVVSDADIYGKKNVPYKNELKRTYQQKDPESIQKKEYFIQIGTYRFGFGSIKNNYTHFTEYSKQKEIAGINIGIRIVTPYSSVNKQYSVKEIQMILSSDFQHYCKELEKKGVVILENDVKIYTWSDVAKAQGTLTIEMPVGQLKKSQLIEIGEPVNGNDGNNN